MTNEDPSKGGCYVLASTQKHSDGSFQLPEKAMREAQFDLDEVMRI